MDQQPSHRDTTKAATTPLPSDARRELALIFVLFVALRVMSAWWFRPLYSEAGEFFFPFAWLQTSGYYPFLDYWLEYPPVLAYLLVGLRALSRWVCGEGAVAWERACFVRSVQLSSVVFETLSLGLVYALVRRVRGQKAAARAAWVYLALFATAFVGLSYVDAFPVFLMLVGLVLAFRGRTVWSGTALACGFMTKLIPAVVLPATLKSTGKWRWRAAALAAFMVFVGYFAAPFLATGRAWLWKSLECAARRPPWETPWALLDQRYGFGYVGPRPDQFQGFYEEYEVQGGIPPTLAATPPELWGEGPKGVVQRYRVASRFARDLSFIDSKPRQPWYWLAYAGVGAVLGLFYLVTFARLPAELPQRRRVVFAAFTLALFFLYSKGWSPQFVLYLVPLLLVAFAPMEGAVWSLLVGFTAFLETPVWTHHVHPLAMMSAATGGDPAMLTVDRALLHAAVLGRTLLLLLIAFRLYPRLWHD